MKEGWTRKPLGELCDVLDSQRKPITKRDRTSGEYPYYGATGVVDYVNDFIFDEPLVLVGEDGAKWESGENTAFPIEGKSWVNNHAHVLRPHRRTVVDNWLIHYLNQCDLNEFVSGLTVPKLTQGSLREIPIPVPPLSEQQRIVGMLDEALSGLATATTNTEKNLQNSRALFESHLQSVFTHRGRGWVEKTMEDLIENSLIGLTRSSKEQSDDKRYPYVKMNHITRDNRFEFTDYVAVDATNDEAARFALEDGDFLFNTRNSHELVGKSCVYSSAAEGVVLFNNNIMRIRFRAGIDARFVLAAFSSREVAEELESMKSGTTNVSAIYFKDLRNLRVPLPSPVEQKRIANEMDALSDETRRLSRLYERKQAALASLKKSILHAAFNGQLTTT